MAADQRELTVACDMTTYLRTSGRLALRERAERDHLDAGKEHGFPSTDDYIASAYEEWAEAARHMGAVRGYRIVTINAEETWSTLTPQQGRQPVEEEIRTAAHAHLELRDDVTSQLGTELRRLGTSLQGLVPGHEQADWAAAIAAEASALSRRLCPLGDDPDAAEAATQLKRALWLRCEPELIVPLWWRTPVGRMCAYWLADEDTRTVTHAIAAVMLDTKRNRIGQMVARGQLERRADGKIRRSSVLRRLAPPFWREQAVPRTRASRGRRV
jgi:hypothetical protein